MTIREHNKAKISELLANCQDRVKLFEEDAFALQVGFKIAEAYRPQSKQYLDFTQGRTLADIELLHAKKQITQADYDALKAIFAAGKNLPGTSVATKTLRSKHTARRAIDIYPIGIVAQKSIQVALARLEMLGRPYGVYRPAETKAFGDFVHFEIVDLPLPVDSPEFQRMMIRRRARIARASSPTPA
jgi:hypothetical protein